MLGYEGLGHGRNDPTPVNLSKRFGHASSSFPWFPDPTQSSSIFSGIIKIHIFFIDVQNGEVVCIDHMKFVNTYLRDIFVFKMSSMILQIDS